MKTFIQFLCYEFGERACLIITRLLVICLFGSVLAVFVASWYSFYVACELAARVLLVPIER